MSRLPLIDEIVMVSSICRDLGLGEVTPAVLKAAHHTTLLISPHMMVARVQSADPVDTAWRRAVAELAVARHLASRGAPVVVPLAELAGPHVARSCVMTLWPFVEHEQADDADAMLAAAALDSVHRALLDYDGDMPPYTEALDRCWSVLTDDVASSSALAVDDRDLLKAQFRRLRQDVEATASGWVPLHGDAHLGNCLMGNHGPLWVDFEDACLGPREYDMAGLPPAAWSAFSGADQALARRCADLKSVCVAIWCWADISRSAEIREAAEYHLHRVRELAR